MCLSRLASCSLLRFLHQAKCIKVRVNHLLIRVLVDLTVWHIANHFLGSSIHRAFHTWIADVRDHRQGDQCLLKLDQEIFSFGLRWYLFQGHVARLGCTFLHGMQSVGHEWSFAF